MILDIIGEQNRECIKLFGILISNSITPQASHLRTKSAQSFEVDYKSLKELDQDHK